MSRGPAGRGAVSWPLSTPPLSLPALVAVATVVAPAASRLSPAGAQGGLPVPPPAVGGRGILGGGGAVPRTLRASPRPPIREMPPCPLPRRLGCRATSAGAGLFLRGGVGQEEAGKRRQGARVRQPCGGRAREAPESSRAPPDREQAKAESSEQPLNRRCALLNEPFT